MACITFVGDVHGQWNAELDEACLRRLAPDTTVFVGDIGNEAVDLVRSVSSQGLAGADARV